jgi:uncharacterized protein (TIGR02246 family)
MHKVLLGVVCTFASVSTVVAGPREDALAVVERWAAAFTASDVDAVMSLYAPDATFLGTSSREVVEAPQDIRRYFERALLNDRPRSAKLDSHTVAVLSDDQVLVTGIDTVTAVRDGTPVSARGRVTFVVARRGAQWRIVHFHRSALPN